jgi:hypothetical protein
MSRKSLVIGLVICLVIGLPIGYFLLQVLPMQQQSTSNNYAGYTKVRVVVAQGATQTFGGIKYTFAYVPDYIDRLGYKQAGYVGVWSELDIVGASFPLTISTPHDYYRIELVITEIQSEYCILMVKSITP